MKYLKKKKEDCKIRKQNGLKESDPCWKLVIYFGINQEEYI
jgi:hypothetical protein